MTQNHNYNTPEQGTLDWHIPLNNNFSALEKDVEVRDAESNRGQYTPHVGSKFYATDTGTEFIGDGESWVRVPSSGKNPTFDSVSAGEVRAKTFPNTANATVRNDNGTYIAFAQDGSVIDSHESDAGAVINSAAQHISQTTDSGVVQISDGNYKLESTVQLVREVALVGSNSHSRYQGGAPVDIDVSGVSRAFEAVGTRRVFLGGMRLDGGGNNVDIIYFDDGSINHLWNLYITNTTGYGIYLEDCGNSTCSWVNVSGCGSQSNGKEAIHVETNTRSTGLRGYHLDAVNDANADDPVMLWTDNERLRLIDCQFKNSPSSTAAVADIRAADAKMYNCEFTSDAKSSGAALHLRSKGGIFTSCVFEKCEYGILLDGANNNRFVNCLSQNNEKAGIKSNTANDGSGCEFIACHTIGNSQDSPGTYPGVDVDADHIKILGGNYGEGTNVSYGIQAQNTSTKVIGARCRGSNGGINGTASFYHCTGHVMTENSGSSSVADGDSIDHMLSYAPKIEHCHVQTLSANNAKIVSTDKDSLEVKLLSPDGTPVNTSETVHWSARLSP